MDDHVSPRQERKQIELIELGELDDVLAEFPPEASLLLDGPNVSGPRESYPFEDEFPSESSSVSEEPSEAPSEAPAQEFQSECASAPVRLGVVHLRGPALAGIAALAVIAITGALGLEALVRWHLGDNHRSAAPVSDVVLVSEATTRPSPASVEDLAPPLGTQTLSTRLSRETHEERAPSPAPPPRRRIIERPGPTTGDGLLSAPTLASKEPLASNTDATPVVTLPRQALDVPALSPVAAASAPTDAGARPAGERLADEGIVAPGRPSVSPVVTADSAIQRALAQYQDAFSLRDVAAVRRVWPTVDGKALARAFDQLRQATLTFDSCDLSVSRRNAVASCGGTTQYVPKVGNKSARVGRQQWRISLHQVTDAWVIDTVEVSRD